MINRERTPWLIGNRKVFRLSKDNCQRLLHAILATNTHVYDMDSTSFSSRGYLIQGVTIGKADALLAVSVPTGSEGRFNDIIGYDILEEPLQISGS